MVKHRPPPSLGLKTLTGPRCPKCGASMVFRTGPRGLFRGCSGFPSCMYTEAAHDLDFVDLHLGFAKPFEESA